MSGLKVAIVGVGAVGQEMIRCLQESSLPLKEPPTVLARSARTLILDGQEISVHECSAEMFQGKDLVFFAGTEGEKGAIRLFGKAALEAGAFVIDNGSDFRMVDGVPLVVPEVNGEELERLREPGEVNLPGIGLVPRRYVANPNCSTIQMVVALKPLHQVAGLRRVIVSTYQAVSGAGSAAVKELEDQAHRILHKMDPGPPQAHPLPIAFNVLAGANWRFEEEGYTNEEWKLVRETRKILGLPDLPISATCVRVPVFTGHAEAIYVELERPLTPQEARDALRSVPGIIIVDEEMVLENGTAYRTYPAPKDVVGRDEVFVGRIRRDPFNPYGLWLWVVADNLRKGAAANAVQIAEELVNRRIVPVN
ncbi:MAG: aspartate-semialdehyde dehydrogenase [Armatimonadetes bacterium]|nr:aspartate-semialdehyde dehydrogenase [Armatimonadota bacterium]MDW8120910.1 aspartate-semialdehyde dehydrogenase [Armatimonadota bacterium]